MPGENAASSPFLALPVLWHPHYIERTCKKTSQASIPFQKEPGNSRQAAMVLDAVQIRVVSPTGVQRWVL